MAENKEKVFIRYEEPLIISSCEEWSVMKSLFIYFVDLNSVEWAQGPIFLHEALPLQDWANVNFPNNEDRAFMIIFLEQTRLHTEAQPLRIFEDGVDCWIVPMFLTSPTRPYGLLSHTPCNLSFTTEFWEFAFRRWALDQFVFP